jgi:hypothetical protein
MIDNNNTTHKMRQNLGIAGVWKISLAFIVAISLLHLSACQKERIYTSSEAMLKFSVDTLSFDTVFTAQGSSTRWLKVYNPYNKAVSISSIRLAGGAASDFNINIDGVSATEQTEVLLRAGDSMYIFVAVRIDPSRGDAIRMDSIYFDINGNQQKVFLEAYGWNANYLGGIGDTTFYVNTVVTLSGTRPYVVAGWHIFENSTLRIEPGVKLYMYGGPTPRIAERALLYFGNNSTIEIGINGSFQNPVIIQTHRLEEDFQDFPYHHDGIYLTSGSKDNRIHNCIIRNATDAIRVDSLSVNSNPKLELKNVFIYNVERSAILARQGSITATNTIIANANKYDIVLLRGGDYNFTHCTFTNYATTSYLRRSQPILSLRDYEVLPDETVVTADGNATFTNCIIYGSRAEEIEVDRVLGSTANLNVVFDHCLIKKDTFSRYFQDCIFNEDPLFQDKDGYDYSLDSLTSPAYRVGRAAGIGLDILGVNRNGSTPDLGAYEWQP